jgi:hypothetical protein
MENIVHQKMKLFRHFLIENVGILITPVFVRNLD